jgi:hypothetical protein
MWFREFITVAFLVSLACYGAAQDPMTSLAESHVQANAPKGKLFEQYLKRDLTRYFCKDRKECRVEYEYLRQGATQSGVSYPSYYLWAKCFSNRKLETEGAVRVMAIDQKYFDVRNCLGAGDIAAAPEKVGNVFPAALVDKLVEKAEHAEFHR